MHRPMQTLRRTGVALVWAVALILAPLSAAQAQNCTAPVNLASNGSFDSGLTGFVSTGNWLFNQTLDPAIYGTIYNSRAAVQNPSAAPSGQDASAYPAATTSAFVIHEEDTSNDSLLIGARAGTHVPYFIGELHIWFDMGWRQAGGASTTAGTLTVQVNGTTYLTITTVAGNGAGNATAALSNGARLGSNTPSTYPNGSAVGALSAWNTIRLIVPYTSGATPTVNFAKSGGGGVSDDFALDRIYAPLCPVTSISVGKSSSVVSDPVNGTTNPKMIPGATIRYCITVTNPAANPSATSVTLSDQLGGLPITYVTGSVRINGTASGTTCNADGSAGGAFAANTVSATLSNIPAGTTRTTYFDVIVN